MSDQGQVLCPCPVQKGDKELLALLQTLSKSRSYLVFFFFFFHFLSNISVQMPFGDISAIHDF